jgi:hypothetical protein
MQRLSYAPAVATARATPFVEFTCDECGVPYQLSTRNERRARRDGRPNRCRECRRHVTPSPQQVAEAREWWLERFRREELQAWPPL